MPRQHLAQYTGFVATGWFTEGIEKCTESEIVVQTMQQLPRESRSCYDAGAETVRTMNLFRLLVADNSLKHGWHRVYSSAVLS